MERKFLEGLNIETEAIESIMAEHGKSIQTLKADNENLKSERDGLKTQLGDVQEKLKAFDEVNVGDLQGKIKQLGDDLTTAQKAHAAELAKIKRQGETREFLSGYKFVNDETCAHYFDKLESALDDDANKGKSRKEIFDTLTNDEDGKPRENIFAAEKPSTPPYAARTGSQQMLDDNLNSLRESQKNLNAHRIIK